MLPSKADKTVMDIYRPMIRAYLTVAASYYCLMTVTHFFYFSGMDLLAMAGVAILATLVGASGAYELRNPISMVRLEKLLVSMNLLMVANVVVALELQFSEIKLVYFVIMAMVFALASASFRQSMLSIAICIAAMLTFAPRLSEGALAVYLFLVFAAALASLSVTYFLRRAIMKIADAKVDTEERLEEAKIVSDTLRERSLSDSLTSLPNRRAFFERIRQAKADDNGEKAIWLVLIDLDGFKAVNDIHGHMVGDILLQSVAARLTAYRSDDVHISRMGGDEFNMLVLNTLDESAMGHWCKEVLQALALPYSIEGRAVRVSGSIGIKRVDLAKEMRSQINQADFALMTAKNRGKNRAVMFGDDHAKQAAERYEIEQALRLADLDTELELLFQPQVDLESNTIVRVEALVRWTSTTVGMIEPSKFIRIAEESGLIAGVTLAVVEKAFTKLASWAHPVPISINLSSHDLITDMIIDEIIAQAKAYRIDAAMIEFEVTETAMMSDFELATANLQRLADAGFEIALDDFGTGYSNFNYLRKLPIGKLKVDRSFMEDPSDPMTEKVLVSLAGMARTLGVNCLLEGVEDEINLLMAKRVGADAVQGFLFGRPMTGDALQEQLEHIAHMAEQSKSEAS